IRTRLPMPGSVWLATLAERALPAPSPFWGAKMPEAMIELYECRDCGAGLQHQAPVCPKCLGTNIGPRGIGGDAVLEAWTVIRKPAPAFADGGPFVVGVPRLRDGDALITGRVDADPAGLHTGAAIA